MFPHANYLPAAFAQGAIHAAVPGLVAGDLVAPEFSVLHGLGLSAVALAKADAVSGAAVPEATVHKHGDAKPGENEIRPDTTGQLPTSNAQL